MDVRSLSAATPFVTADGSTIRELCGLPTGGTVNQSLAEASLEPGQATERHYHAETEEIYFVLEGEGELELDGARGRVRQGDGVPIAPRCLAPAPKRGGRDAPHPLLLRPAVPPRRHLLRVASDTHSFHCRHTSRQRCCKRSAGV